MELVQTAGLSIMMSSDFMSAEAMWRSTLKTGIWVGVLNAGRLRIIREDGSVERWTPGTHCAFNLKSPETIDHIPEVDGTCSAIFVHIKPDDMALLLSDEEASSLMLHGPSGKNLQRMSRPRSALIATLGRRMEATQQSGLERRFYLGSKALEMLAVMSADVVPEQKTDLSPTEIRAVREARDRAMARIEDPPSVPELAKAVGLSVRRLSSGFRALYDQPLYAFVKEERLKLARRLLEDSDLTVSQVAHAIGYGPAHFSTAIRARYGVAPQDLQPR